MDVAIAATRTTATRAAALSGSSSSDNNIPTTAAIATTSERKRDTVNFDLYTVCVSPRCHAYASKLDKPIMSHASPWRHRMCVHKSMVSMVMCAYVYDAFLFFGSGRSVSRFGRCETGGQYCETVKFMKEAKFAKSVTSTYVKFAKSVTITMVLAQWRRWAKATPPIPWWSAERPLRVATDCTGLAVAEVSLQTLAATLGADIHTVFACDIWSGIGIGYRP